MKKFYETIMTSAGSDSRAFSGRWRRFIIFSVFFLGFLFAGTQQANAAVLGMARDSYGVWDREGGHPVSSYPYTRGQECDLSWGAVNTARSNFTWTAIDSLLQIADDQNQMFTVKVSPIDGSAPGKSMPTWMFTNGVPKIICPSYTYGLYTNENFKIYFSEMVKAFAKHVRQDVVPSQQNRIAFVRVDTGCTGDESPYEGTDVSSVPAQYQISAQAWQDYRLWVFELYRQAFQTGPGPVIPLMFVAVEPPQFQTEWNWVSSNIVGGVGIKHGSQLRGYHLSESESNVEVWKPLSLDSNFKIFSRNEMDQTWKYYYFQLNLPLTMYWTALEQLNVGMSIWDWSGTCLEAAVSSNMVFTATLFNTWAAELDPATARGGFCVFHEGLDSADGAKFPTSLYGGGVLIKGNTNRYTAICAAYSNQGARMDHLEAATWGSVKQRNPPPDGMNGFNDSGWQIHPGNYDRFITQINPTNESLGLWRVRGTVNTSSHPYDRFARRFDRASNRNAMRFDVNDHLTPTPGQRIQLSVVYLDSGTNRFGLLYDAVGNSQKSAFTVTKANSNTWKTNSVVVTDWAFTNGGPYGSDLVLTNLDSSGDTTFHSIELTKLVSVTVNTIGSGTVSARTDDIVYSPVTGTNYATGQRLEMTVTPAAGSTFTGWSGDLSGTDAREILYPTNVNTQVTATFTNASGNGVLTSSDNFNSGGWTGGTGWSGGWTNSGTVVSGVFVELNGTTANPQITRTLAVPIPNATLSFDWDLDRIGPGESGKVEVYDGAWRLVWEQADPGTDPNNAGNVDLLTATIDLSAYGSISQIRFTLNASGSNNRFFIDNVSVTGTVAAVPTYTLTVSSGSGSGSYTNGRQVAISANAPAVGKAFSQWIGDTQYVASASSASTTVTMSTNAVSLTATYVDVYYALTIINSTGSGSFTNGQQVTISADVPPGMAFAYWTGDMGVLVSNTSPTTFIMPGSNITLTANYFLQPGGGLTVNGGIGSGFYYPGTAIPICADDPPPGWVFDHWTGDTAYLADSNAACTTLTMPAANIAVTATYKLDSVTLIGQGSTGGSVSVIPGYPATFVITASNYYRIAAVFTNGGNIGVAFNNNSTNYTLIWSNVQAVTVTALFVQQVTTNAPAPVPYEWLANYVVTNDYNAAANADQDVDGLKAWQEYITGTDPTNAASVLKAVQNTRNTITWSPVSGRVYSVYWSTNLMKGFQPLETNILYPQSGYTNATPDSRVNHYQIKVRLQ